MSVCRAMQLLAPGQALSPVERPLPQPTAGQALIAVEACGVCRTDLHLLDGELPAIRYPIVPGHEIVGRIAALGSATQGLHVGQRVGVPWLGWSCGTCAQCRAGRENLCDDARFTGYQIDGGYATHTLADVRYCFALPDAADAAALAPLLCAGLIGYRALRMAGDGRRLGIYGFGAAAHIVCQVAVQQGREVYAFTRRGDTASQAFALSLGAGWAGDAEALPPQALDAALIFAPVGALVPVALRAVAKGGSVVCAGIHMSDIPAFPYAILWGERSVRSVANLTRRDGAEFFALTESIAIKTAVTRYPLDAANAALADLRGGRLQGAAVLVP
ncbi:MAG: zinc-dependent alcohol dehydrogenase family protein [Rhodocyclales bacterium]|nr:zinc-dependent alcohol dehydrogenase family protein [Rhodocyclales bacterium]